MFVGVLYLDCIVPGSKSLKQKRQAIKSLKDRLRNRFNVAVSETEYQDKWQRAGIGVATVSGEHTHTQRAMDEIEKFVLAFPAINVIKVEREVL